MEERIREALRADAATSAYADTLALATAGGRVAVSGVVEDIDDTDNIVEVISRVSGVAEVIEQLESGGNRLTSRAIAAGRAQCAAMGLREIPIQGGQPAEHLVAGMRSLCRGRAPGAASDTDGDRRRHARARHLVSGERSFPGIAWRIGEKAYEAFFIRPHQVGNPDAVQYTPVFNNVFGWQLYHGKGHWAPVDFPIGEWFTLRVAFCRRAGEAYLRRPSTPALVFGRLRAPLHRADRHPARWRGRALRAPGL